jgi:hypothetical protein
LHSKQLNYFTKLIKQWKVYSLLYLS